LNGADIPVENSKGEARAGQEEINVRYTDALTMADRHAIMKNGCKEIAWSKQRSISFLAKWHNDHAGSSSHIHQSLAGLDGGSLFFDPNKEHGMSDLMRQYLAGQLNHADATTYFLAPYINSYKRFMAGTFAPTKAVWSMDNRTARYRICAGGTDAVRIECRIGGADLNPYLAMATLIAAGIDVIERQSELEPAFTGDACSDAKIREIPSTLRAATVALDQSDMLPVGLWQRGDRSLRPRSSLGTTRIRPPHHRVGSGPRVRAGVNIQIATFVPNGTYNRTHLVPAHLH